MASGELQRAHTGGAAALAFFDAQHRQVSQAREGSMVSMRPGTLQWNQDLNSPGGPEADRRPTYLGSRQHNGEAQEQYGHRDLILEVGRLLRDLTAVHEREIAAARTGRRNDYSTASRNSDEAVTLGSLGADMPNAASRVTTPSQSWEAAQTSAVTPAVDHRTGPPAEVARSPGRTQVIPADPAMDESWLRRKQSRSGTITASDPQVVRGTMARVLRQDWHVDDNTMARVKSNIRLKKKLRKDKDKSAKEGEVDPRRKPTEDAEEEADEDAEEEEKEEHLSSSRTRLARFMLIHPDRPLRFVLDCIGMALLVIDIIWLPLAVFPLEDSPFMDSMGLFTLLFWTMDIVMNFNTGVYLDGHLIRKHRKIARVYMTSWFPFDLGIVSFDWILLLIGSGREFSSSLRSVRIARFARLLRLLRLPRMKRLINNMMKQIRSTSVKLLLALVGHVSLILVVTHLLACVWYALGASSSEGWVRRLDFQGLSVAYLYLSALHWSLCNIHGTMEVGPGTEAERAFTVVVTFWSMILASWFISSMTEQLMCLKLLSQERREQEEIMMDYLRERNVTTDLQNRIRSLLDEEQLLQEPKHKQELKLLGLLPKDLREMVMDQTRRPRFLKHKLFKTLNMQHAAALRRICNEAMAEVHPHVGSEVFKSGDACDRMMMVTSGQLTYYHDDNHLQASTAVRETSSGKDGDLDIDDDPHLLKINVGTMVCEAALWTLWQNVGDLSSRKDSRLIAVIQSVLKDALSHHEEALVYASRYAQDYVSKMNENGCTDLGLLAKKSSSQDIKDRLRNQLEKAKSPASTYRSPADVARSPLSELVDPLPNARPDAGEGSEEVYESRESLESHSSLVGSSSENLSSLVGPDRRDKSQDAGASFVLNGSEPEQLAQQSFAPPAAQQLAL